MESQDPTHLCYTDKHRHHHHHFLQLKSAIILQSSLILMMSLILTDKQVGITTVHFVDEEIKAQGH